MALRLLATIIHKYKKSTYGLNAEINKYFCFINDIYRTVYPQNKKIFKPRTQQVFREK